MMPKPELLAGIEVEGINIQNMLEMINKRIEYLYDRNHTIGHSYFMSLKDNPTKKELDNIFRNRIIPLLQEYFYDDYEKIQIVLGDHPKQFEDKNIKDEKLIEKYQFIQSKKKSNKEILGFDYEEKEEFIEYSINPEFKVESYIKIYGEYPKPKKENQENEEVNNS